MSNALNRLHRLFSSTRKAGNSIKSKTRPIKNPKPTKTTQCLTSENQDIHSGIKDLLDESDCEKIVEKFKSLSKSSYFRQSSKVYDNIIYRLVLSKQPSLIEDVLESQKDYISEEGFAAQLICLYGKAGMFEHAHKLFDELLQRGYKQVSVLDEMEENGFKPCFYSFNTLLGAFYEKGKFEDGDKIWERMIKNGVKPGIITYNIKLHRLFNDGKFSEAMSLFMELKNKGIKLNVGTYNACILGCCKNDDLDGLRKWYSDLLNHCGVPNGVTFSIIIPFLCDKGDYDFAFQVCERIFMRPCSVDEALLQKVVDGLVKNSMMEEAEILVGLGKANRFFPYRLVLPSQC